MASYQASQEHSISNSEAIPVLQFVVVVIVLLLLFCCCYFVVVVLGGGVVFFLSVATGLVLKF